MSKEKVLAYIKSHWDECVKENRNDEGTLLGMPYPYTVPAVGHFDEMYYWDTYFTNQGLKLSNRWHLVKSNTDNMLYMVERYGYMPNGNREGFLGRSQPPFLSLMVYEVFSHYQDKVWLRGAYETLKKEYAFWTEQRKSGIDGLSSYGGAYTPQKAEQLRKRVQHCPEGTDEALGRHFIICCESGADISPRWEFEGYNYAQIDLNSLLYAFEKNMEFFAEKLGEDSTGWQKKAENRKALMQKWMTDKEGFLNDYNFVKETTSPVLSTFAFYPLFVGAAREEEAAALVKNLYRLEADYGVVTCEENNIPGVYQWSYPNGWACQQYIVVEGLKRYGYEEEARRIAGKYLALIEKTFMETENLWEKYNVVEGNINVANEYDMPKMMGWTAGTYLALLDYIEK